MTQNTNINNPAVNDDDLDDILNDALNNFEQNKQTVLNSTLDNKEEIGAEPLKNLPKSSSTGSDANPPNKNFQDSISLSLEQMKIDSQNIKNETNKMEDEDLLSDLLKQFEDLSENPDFEKNMEGIMDQILNKDLLYEPMKELSEKYPLWLEKNKQDLDTKEFEKYTKQQEVVCKIVETFEQSNNDSHQTNSNDESVVELMHKMQELGQPPTSLLKEVSPDLNFDKDGMPNLNENSECSIM